MSRECCTLPDGPFLDVEQSQPHVVALPQKPGRRVATLRLVYASHHSLPRRTSLSDKLHSIHCKQHHHAVSRP
jgi:hypothetical protein